MSAHGACAAACDAGDRLLSIGSPEFDAPRLTGLRQGMSEAGYVEGRDLAIEYQWAGDQIDRLPALAAHLSQIPVALIVTVGRASTLAAKAATTTIPILFVVGADPVQIGLVASLNRPGGNLTGFDQFNRELGAKTLSLLHELVPGAPAIGLLDNPNKPIDVELTTRDVLAAAATMGLQIQTLKASTIGEIDAAFESLVQARTGALLVANDVFLNSHIEQIITLATRVGIPAMYPSREYVTAGGLVSYGTSITDFGLYAGRILKGSKPADLPVVRSTKIPLVINLKTAKALGLAIPDKLLALADEVIE